MANSPAPFCRPRFFQSVEHLSFGNGPQPTPQRPRRRTSQLTNLFIRLDVRLLQNVFDIDVLSQRGGKDLADVSPQPFGERDQKLT